MAWPAVKKAFTQEQFRAYAQGLTWAGWRPSLIVWHNTAAPTLGQWKATAASDRAAGRLPGITRINNLDRYFRVERGWSGAPHLFIADDLIWVFNPLTAAGVHSPSWNSRSLGFEMCADFSREDDDSGDGLRVKNNCILATAVLCEALGLDPYTAIKLHKEDPATTHDCPGKNLAQDKAKMISDVLALMAGGEHDEGQVAEPEREGITTVGELNIRSGPGVVNPSIQQVAARTPVVILAEARNGTTNWLQVRLTDNTVGWVAGKYVKG